MDTQTTAVIRSQLFRHETLMLGSSLSHFRLNSSRFVAACSAVVAAYIVLRSTATSLRLFQDTYFKLCRTMCTIHNCTCVCGYPASIASGNPFNPSTQAMKMSFTPRFFSCRHYLHPELCPLGLRRPHPKNFFYPFHGNPYGQVYGFVLYLTVIA